MSKKKKRRHSFQRREPRQPGQPDRNRLSSRPLTPEGLRQDGLRAFKAGHYTAAINTWEKLDLSDNALAAALAEAHFRRAAEAGLGPGSLPDLERASAIVSADPIYAYYLGLALHKTGRVVEATEAYRRAAANGLSRQGAGRVMALAALELDPHTDLATVPGVSSEDRQWIGPLANFLQGKPQAQPSRSLMGGITERLKLARPSAAQQVFDGLTLLADQKTAEARQALTSIEGKGLPRSVNAVRWYYIGVGAAHAGDTLEAVEAWKQARHLQPDLPGLRDNLAAGYARQSASQAQVGDWPVSAHSALEGLEMLPGDTTLSHLAITALDRAARQAAQAGDWEIAAEQWATARYVLGSLSGGGTPRPILHNLALAYEAIEQWEGAADAWRAMLRTQARKKKEGLSQEHWAWVRRRVIECYKQAGRPDEAVTVFRQALKANPEDSDMQLELVEALLANDQHQAAWSELNKLLKKHPKDVEALSRMAELHGASEDWDSAEMVMRQALDVEPDDQDLRHRMAHILAERGYQFHQWRQYAQARTRFENAIKYTPDDYTMHFHLARLEFDARKLEAARQHLERALELGKDEPDAYLQAFICWIVENNLNEARDILARAENSGKLTLNLYIHAGIECLQRSVPPPDTSDPFSSIFGRRGSKPSRQKDKPDARRALGQELLERAIALGPEGDVLHHIVAEIGPGQPELSLPYAQRLSQHAPDDPGAWIPLGLLYGVNGRVKEAKEALRQAERLARKQGNHAMASEIREMKRVVADPFFSSLIHMAPFMDEFGFDLDDSEMP
jgi:tetratricopeptide (TPR) repeat protein